MDNDSRNISEAEERVWEHTLSCSLAAFLRTSDSSRLLKRIGFAPSFLNVWALFSPLMRTEIELIGTMPVAGSNSFERIEPPLKQELEEVLESKGRSNYM